MAAMSILSEGHVMSPGISPIVPQQGQQQQQEQQRAGEKRPLSRRLKEEEDGKKKGKKKDEDGIDEESEDPLTVKKGDSKKVDSVGCVLDKSATKREEMKVKFEYKVEGPIDTIANLDDELDAYELTTNRILMDSGLIDCAVFGMEESTTASLITDGGGRRQQRQRQRGLRRLDEKIHVVSISAKPADKISKKKECETDEDDTDCEYVDGSIKLILQEDPDNEVNKNKTQQQEAIYDETIDIIKKSMRKGSFDEDDLIVTYVGADEYNGTNVTVSFAESSKNEAGDVNGTSSSGVSLAASVLVSVVSGMSLTFVMF